MRTRHDEHPCACVSRGLDTCAGPHAHDTGSLHGGGLEQREKVSMRCPQVSCGTTEGPSPRTVGIVGDFGHPYKDMCIRIEHFVDCVCENGLSCTDNLGADRISFISQHSRSNQSRSISLPVRTNLGPLERGRCRH